MIIFLINLVLTHFPYVVSFTGAGSLQQECREGIFTPLHHFGTLASIDCSYEELMLRFFSKIQLAVGR